MLVCFTLGKVELYLQRVRRQYWGVFSHLFQWDHAKVKNLESSILLGSNNFLFKDHLFSAMESIRTTVSQC